ncbi:MAG: hypothetical protein MRY21_05160 [Simkaniaceae bacterium]|nr:hypothetical protein [Simkaniaceae bacterium]
MRYLPLIFAFFTLSAFECELIYENDLALVYHVVMQPHEEIGLHRDSAPMVITALQGGVVRRLETDGREVDVEFPTGVAVYRTPDPEGEFHRSVSLSDSVIELITVVHKTKR